MTMASLPARPSTSANANVPINSVCSECSRPASESRQGYINVHSHYRDFSDVGVGHALSITSSDGEVLEEPEVRLPIGSAVQARYGPFPEGTARVTLSPLLNHHKQGLDEQGAWTQEVDVLANGEVDVRFEFVETDTWDPRYTTARINQLHADHVQRFLVFINKVEEDTGHQYRVADGLRTNAEQDALYCNSRATSEYCVNLGLTNGTGAWRSNAMAGQSYHNYGLAVDIYRFDEDGALVNPDGDVDTVGSALEITWGSSFGDPPHFQYSAQTIAELQSQQ